MRRAVLAGALSSIALVACEAARTEVLIVIDSDLAVPDELDHVRIDLIGPGGEPRRSEGAITALGDLPKTLGVVDATHRARDVRVTITGLRRGANVVQRRAVFTFVPRETRVLRLDLLRGCLGVSCGADETCGDDGCRPIRVLERELTPYPGELDRGDAGMHADGCAAAAEACNARDDDCDGHTDEGFALDRDPEHCGACGRACAPAPDNAASSCDAGACVLSCDPDFADCNEREDDGCEAALSSAAHCGACGTACAAGAPLCAVDDAGYRCAAACAPGTSDCGGACVDITSSPLACGGCGHRCDAPDHAVATCVSARCGFRCDDGFADCDGEAANGCESDLRGLAHCGACGAPCARPGAVVSCASGVCETIACAPLRGDCDGNPSNGCETDLGASVLACGECGASCPSAGPNATAICDAGRCGHACQAGFADCDGRADTGCEISVTSPTSCGGCGIACGPPAPYCEEILGGYTCSDVCTTGTACEMSCVDLASDPSHCGGCGVPCPSAPNARSECRGGACALSCESGWDDCDEVEGCETFVAGEPDACGGCGVECPSAPQAAPACVDGACALRCQRGYADCNEDPTDGCEVWTMDDAANCGRCGNACGAGPAVASSECAGGACRITSCAGLYGDCDRNALNGCETDLSADGMNCGACGVRCGGSRRCCAGACRRPADC